jgi:hypothetical protein
LRNLFGIALVEIRKHFVSDFVLRLRAARTAAIAGRMKNDLTGICNVLDGMRISAEHFSQR